MLDVASSPCWVVELVSLSRKEGKRVEDPKGLSFVGAFSCPASRRRQPGGEGNGSKWRAKGGGAIKT